MGIRRLPSFNDFSPAILKGDLRPCLQAIADGGGDDANVIEKWTRLYFGGKKNKRASTNIPATLRSTGMTSGTRPMTLSAAGETVRLAPDAVEASRRFCTFLLKERNGLILVDALSALRVREEPITKQKLKAELEARGIEALSTNTTDHTTFKNWLAHAGLIDASGTPNDAALKSSIGISATEADELKSITLPQQIFLNLLRREHEVGTGHFHAKDLLRSCLDTYPHLFDESQFAKQVREPLMSYGWIEAEGLAKGAQGGKSGRVKGTPKLLAIPIEQVVPDFEQVIPADLREKINRPLREISEDLFSDNKHKAGLALELLALRMIMDLGLDPRHFRLRSAQTAFAEVDLIAEGMHLLFSRWTFQCKRNASGTKVGLSDVAKEVGIAVFAKAHVIVMVTTSQFSRDAINYAQEVTRTTPLQFVFVDGSVVKRYLRDGKAALLDYFIENSKNVMATKRSQPLPEGT
jgi:hypothetical protein